MASESSPIPAFYRVVFTLIDPFFCALGVATRLFTKNDVIAGLSPSAAAAGVPPSAETALLLDFLAGFSRCSAASSTLVLDAAMAAATARKLLVEGRTDPSVWLGGEWQNLVGNAVIGAVRAAFVLGVGMRGERAKTA